ncbi:hypothetical protein HK405_005187 [Cladochytrium tenue]|nr:hypothetical protein HK405_005187 [Cladochytrium tenue]
MPTYASLEVSAEIILSSVSNWCSAVPVFTSNESPLQRRTQRKSAPLIFSIGFGRQLGWLEQKTPIAFATAFDAAQVQVMSRFYTPPWWLFELPAAVAADAGDSDDGARGGSKSGSEANLLRYLMRSTGSISGQLPSPDQLVDSVINFIFARRDTTVRAFSRAFLMLRRHPAARDAPPAGLGGRGVPASGQFH